MIDLLWEQAREVLYLTKEEFIQSLQGWTLEPQYGDDGEIVCIYLKNGPKFHFATFGKRWKLTRADIRKHLVPIIEQYGYVETFTPKEDTRQHRFNRMLGFFQTHEDALYIHFRLERLRHV